MGGTFESGSLDRFYSTSWNDSIHPMRGAGGIMDIFNLYPTDNRGKTFLCDSPERGPSAGRSLSLVHRKFTHAQNFTPSFYTFSIPPQLCGNPQYD
jgi:hypothetical protein